MVIFGGNDGDTCYNDVVLLTSSPTSTSSSNATAANDTTDWTWSRPNVTGQLPRPRTGHSACLLEDGKTLMIHGGWNPSDSDKEEVRHKEIEVFLYIRVCDLFFSCDDISFECFFFLINLLHLYCRKLMSNYIKIEYFNDAYLLNTDNWEWRAAPPSFLDQLSSTFALKGSGGVTGHVMECVAPNKSKESNKSTDDSTTQHTIALFGGQCANGERINDMAMVSF
jgi:hypothetical protein